ncbi:hypothetical protein Val02_75890 [Virgisporangium aliadipatigenens]|uniref:alpha-amylase n=1 Tax=Virgisporangium aliadipatigenens TaxID=741659 RepID=A0A8J3YUF1_9ACTN|nr:carboxypeptidase-like regulatory domain-containing protein [Virgisporangium aliadipatigenens]GIJ50703.1 hypothetical protein Val02_75890 [Virgisporangium aliadipatigenens]
MKRLTGKGFFLFLLTAIVLSLAPVAPSAARAAAYGAIAGTVTDSSGAPAAGVEVAALDSTGSTWGIGRSGADGRYDLSILPAGAYRLRFSPPAARGVQQWAPGKRRAAEATAHTVHGGGTTVVDERLLPMAELVVHLQTADGQPYVDAQFLAKDEFSEFELGRSGNDGVVRARVYAGTYTARFLEPGTGRVQYVPGSRTEAGAQPFSVAPDSVTELTERRIGAGSLRVTARDRDTGAAVPDFCASADGGRDECSNGGGVVLLTGVIAGSVGVSVRGAAGAPYGYADTTATVVAGATVDIDVPLPGVGTVTTVVRAADTGVPLRGACVALLEKGSFSSYRENFAHCSDNSGAVTIPQREAGDYIMFVKGVGDYGAQIVGTSGGTGDERQARVVTVAGGQVTVVPDVRLDVAGAIVGTVTDEAGAPVANGKVSLTPWHSGGDNQSGFTVRADADGRYTMSGLGPYAWPLLFSFGAKPHQWSGGTGDRYAAEAVAVTSGGSATYDYVMRDGATVTGTSSIYGWVVATNATTGDYTGLAWVYDGVYTMRVIGPQVIRVEGGDPVAVPASGTVVVDLP